MNSTATHQTRTLARRTGLLAAIAAVAMMIAPAIGAAAPVKFGSKLNPTVQPSNSLPGLDCGEVAGPCTMVQQRSLRSPRRRRARPEDRHDQEDPADRRRSRQLQAADRQGEAVDPVRHQRSEGRRHRPADQLPGPDRSQRRSEQLQGRDLQRERPGEEGPAAGAEGNITSMVRCSSGGDNTLIYTPPLGTRLPPRDQHRRLLDPDGSRHPLAPPVPSRMRGRTSVADTSGH